MRAIQNQVFDDVSVLGMEILRRIDALAAEIAQYGIAESKAERARVDELGRDFAQHISEMIDTFGAHALEQVEPLWPGEPHEWREVRFDYLARLGMVDHYVRGFIAGGGVLWSLIRGLGDGPWDRASVTRCLRSRLLFVHEQLEVASLAWTEAIEARLSGGEPLASAPQALEILEAEEEAPLAIGLMPDLGAPEVPIESDYTFSDDTNDAEVVLPPLIQPEDDGRDPFSLGDDDFGDLDDLPPLTPMGAAAPERQPQALQALPAIPDDDEDEDDAPTVLGGRPDDDGPPETMLAEHHTFDLFGEDDDSAEEDEASAEDDDGEEPEALEALPDASEELEALPDASEALPDASEALEALPEEAFDEIPDLPEDAFEPTTAEIPLEALPDLPDDAFTLEEGDLPDDEDTLLRDDADDLPAQGGQDDGLEEAMPAQGSQDDLEEALPADEADAEEALPAAEDDDDADVPVATGWLEEEASDAPVRAGWLEEEESVEAAPEEPLPVEPEPVEEDLPSMPSLQERFDAVIALAGEWDIQVNNLPEVLEEDWVGVLEARVGELVERRREKATEEAERQARLESLMALADELKVRVKKVPERPSQSWLDKMAAKLHEVQAKRGAPPSFAEAADLQTEEASHHAAEPEAPAEDDGDDQAAAEEEAVLAQRRARIDAIVEKAERMGVPLGRVPDQPTEAWVVQTEAKLEQFLARRRDERKAEREKKKKERQERIERIQREAAELDVDIGKVPPFPTDDWLNRADLRIAQTMLKRGEERPVPPELEAEEAEESEELIPQIVYEPGTLQEQRWIVDRDMVIGRAPDSDIQIIFDGGISRRHCRIRVVGDMAFEIEDAGSTKGTMVDGEKIQAALPLGFGSVIQIGDTRLQFDMLPMEQ